MGVGRLLWCCVKEAAHVVWGFEEASWGSNIWVRLRSKHFKRWNKNQVKFKEPKKCHDGCCTERSGQVAGDRFGRARRQKWSLVSSKGNGGHSHQSDVIRFQLSKGHSLVWCGVSGLEGDSLRDGTSPSTWLQLCELLKTVAWINRKWREREPDWRGNSYTEWVRFGDWLATWHAEGEGIKDDLWVSGLSFRQMMAHLLKWRHSWSSAGVPRDQLCFSSPVGFKQWLLWGQRGEHDCAPLSLSLHLVEKQTWNRIIRKKKKNLSFLMI